MRLPLTIDDRRRLRMYILQALDANAPDATTEAAIQRYLHVLQQLPPWEEALRELDYLRNRGFLRSTPVNNPLKAGEKLYLHYITAEGHEVATGEREDEHVSI